MLPDGLDVTILAGLAGHELAPGAVDLDRRMLGCERLARGNTQQSIDLLTGHAAMIPGDPVELYRFLGGVLDRCLRKKLGLPA